jgi:hypothetical protein
MIYPTIVSHSGTRHIVGIPPGQNAIRAHVFRITTLCGFGVRPKDAQSEATCDCQFCLKEWEVIERQEQMADPCESAPTVPPSSCSTSAATGGAFDPNTSPVPE